MEQITEIREIINNETRRVLCLIITFNYNRNTLASLNGKL